MSHIRTVADAEVDDDRGVQVSSQYFGTGPRTSLQTPTNTSDHPI